MSKRFIGMVLAVMLIAAMLIPAAVSEVTTMYVYTSTGISLNVRSTPEITKNNIIGSVKYGAEVQVQNYLDTGWALIIFNDKTGYVASKYLSATKPPEIKTDDQPQVIDPETALQNMNGEFKSAKKVTPYKVGVNPPRTSTWINMRWAPSTATHTIATYRPGSVLIVIAECNHWLQVQDPNTGYVGYIWREYTTRVN